MQNLNLYKNMVKTSKNKNAWTSILVGDLETLLESYESPGKTEEKEGFWKKITKKLKKK